MITLEEAVKRYSATLFRYCSGVLCDYHEAQDAVQETFIKAYTKRESYRYDDNFGGWLYRIAYNTCLSMLRKKRFRPLGWGDSSKARESVSSDSVEGRFLSEGLLKALRTLSAKERALIFSRALDDLDFRQLAIVYNTSAETLRKRYERARKKLQKHFLKNGNERSEPLCINIPLRNG